MRSRGPYPQFSLDRSLPRPTADSFNDQKDSGSHNRRGKDPDQERAPTATYEQPGKRATGKRSQADQAGSHPQRPTSNRCHGTYCPAGGPSPFWRPTRRGAERQFGVAQIAKRAGANSRYGRRVFRSRRPVRATYCGGIATALPAVIAASRDSVHGAGFLAGASIAFPAGGATSQ